MLSDSATEEEEKTDYGVQQILRANSKGAMPREGRTEGRAYETPFRIESLASHHTYIVYENFKSLNFFLSLIYEFESNLGSFKDRGME